MAGKQLSRDAVAYSAALPAAVLVSNVKASVNGTDNASNAEHFNDMPTVPVPARKAATTLNIPSKRERIEAEPPITQFIYRVTTYVLGAWPCTLTQVVRQWDWYPRVEPYMGHGTGNYSHLVCRTVYAPRRAQSDELICSTRGMLVIPTPRTHVQASIDDILFSIMQIGVSEVYDRVGCMRDLGSEYAISGPAGYPDPVAGHCLVLGTHHVSYSVANRKPVSANLYTAPVSAKVGTISDVDDTIIIIQALVSWRVVYNLLFLDPKKKASMPGMSVPFTRIADLFPGVSFFYLSTSPWSMESSICNFITDHGFPEDPLLLRNLDPRPKTFVSTGPQYKLESAEQLMASFPDMRFVLIGDDRQKDPATYTTVVHEYSGRVLAIVIHELSPRELTGLVSVTGLTSTQSTPVTDVPIFTSAAGSSILKTMLSYLKTVL